MPIIIIMPITILLCLLPYYYAYYRTIMSIIIIIIMPITVLLCLLLLYLLPYYCAYYRTIMPITVLFLLCLLPYYYAYYRTIMPITCQYSSMHSRPKLYFLSFLRVMMRFGHQLFLRPLRLLLVSCMYFLDLEIPCFTFLADGEIPYFSYLCPKLRDVVFPEPSRTFSNCLVQERCSGRQFLPYISVHTSQRTQSTFILKPSRIKLSTSSCKVLFLSDFNQSCDVPAKFPYRAVS